MELAIESGAPGLVLLLAAIIALALRLAAQLRAGGEAAIHAAVAGSILAVLAIHSIVDYPLRAMTLAVLAALAVGLLAMKPEEKLRRVDAA